MNLKTVNVFSHKHSFPVHLSVGGIVIKDNHVILQYKKTTGKYRIPSETPEVFDNIASVISRLGREELGLKLKPVYLVACDNSHTFLDERGRQVNKITIYFKCEVLAEVQAEPLDYEQERYEFHWLSISQALQVLAHAGRGEEKILLLALKKE